MTDLQALIAQIDALPSEDFKTVLRHMHARQMVYWKIDGEQLREIQEIMQPAYEEIAASGITDEEIDSAIDDAIAEVRRDERIQAQRRD